MKVIRIIHIMLFIIGIVVILGITKDIQEGTVIIGNPNVEPRIVYYGLGVGVGLLIHSIIRSTFFFMKLIKNYNKEESKE